MRVAWALAALLPAAGCGTGTDGTPVAPTSTPAPPAPAPPPEPPRQPTGIRVVERGQDFIVWAWEPVEGATGYEGHAFPDGIPVFERPPHQVTAEPTFRAEGLEPGVLMGFFVRAIRETAGGRAVGLWSDYAPAYTLVADIPVAACSNERQLALDWQDNPVLAHATQEPSRCGKRGAARVRVMASARSEARGGAENVVREKTRVAREGVRAWTDFPRVRRVLWPVATRFGRSAARGGARQRNVVLGRAGLDAVEDVIRGKGRFKTANLEYAAQGKGSCEARQRPACPDLGHPQCGSSTQPEWGRDRNDCACRTSGRHTPT